MLTALIVDDEKKICDLITCLGDWNGLGVEVIGTCTDGEEALEFIKSRQPDIVLTDIRMPVYDGLEIIIKSREAGYQTAFIVISGYRQFEYAQKALQYGVIDFLVKPIEKKMLNDALLKAAADRRRKNKNAVARRQMSQLLEEKKRWEKELFWTHVLSSKAVGQVPEAAVEFAGDMFQAIVIKTNRTELNTGQSKFSAKLKTFCEEQLSDLNEMIFISKDREFFVLLNYNRDEIEEIRSKFYCLYRKIEGLDEIFGPFACTFGLGIPVGSIGEMQRSIMTARVAWQARIGRVSKDIITYGELKFSPITDQDLILEMELYSMKKYCENYDSENAMKIIYQMEARAAQHELVSPMILFSLIERLLYGIVLDLAGVAAPQAGARIGVLTEELEVADSTRDLFMKLRQQVRRIIEESRREKASRERLPIRLAKEYMSANYMKEITLERIAEVAGISTVYFSRLFKEVEGKNYIDYLTELRIGIAKKLLTATNAGIKAIAVDTGYGDERYFRKVFKKVTGIKPSDYRKLH